MKNCPFCKNSIEEDSDYCSFCGRVLVERFEDPIQPQEPQEKAKDSFFQSQNSSSKGVFTHIKDNFRRYFFLTGGIILLIVFLSFFANSDESPSVVIPVVPIQDTPAASATFLKDPSTYTSLANGKIFSKNANLLRGDGELSISNGTSSDAIAKLVSNTTGKSIFTVYIKANNSYEIKNISDGNYKLLFNLGNDWSNTNRAFAVNSSYEVFEDPFVFRTTSTKYMTFSVTLNPVVGGDAETNPTNPEEFGNY